MRLFLRVMWVVCEGRAAVARSCVMDARKPTSRPQPQQAPPLRRGDTDRRLEDSKTVHKYKWPNVVTIARTRVRLLCDSDKTVLDPIMIPND